jgi:tRNA pseudouridine38-40 synthase
VPRYRLTIEYAGTRYSGWQIQKNARTVQGELDKAIRTVTGRSDFELYGSGRTDAGVHAIGQVAHLDVASSQPPASLVRRVNDELPSDINVLSAVSVPHRFHARHSAIARRYVYQITRRRTAFAKPYVWWVKESLDLDAMRTAAAHFVGMKDFQSFAAEDDGGGAGTARPPSAEDAGSEGARGGRLGRSQAPLAQRETPGSQSTRSTLVLVDRLDVIVEGDLVLVVIQGSHFLWKMVRRIVGVLAEIGRGGLTPTAAESLLSSKSDLPARLTAPASGLFLERVLYQGDPLDAPVIVPTPVDTVGSIPARLAPSLVPSTRRTTSV